MGDWKNAQLWQQHWLRYMQKQELEDERTAAKSEMDHLQFQLQASTDKNESLETLQHRLASSEASNQDLQQTIKELEARGQSLQGQMEESLQQCKELQDTNK